MTKPDFKIATLFASLLAVFISAGFGQTAGNDAPIKVDTVLINVPVIATDRDGRNIAGLTKENFIVKQNGETQTIDFFADEKAPMNVAIVIDLSGSTRGVLDDIKKAAREFIKTFRPEDKGLIVGFDDQEHILSEFTSDRNKLKKAIDDAQIGPHPGSRMQDALYQVVTKEFAAVKGRKAIIVLTDGAVAGRYISNRRLLNTVIESDILIYPIFFETYRLFPPDVKAVTLDQLTAKFPINYLNMLAIATGGRFYAAGQTDFKESFRRIADELKNQYLVGFYPQNLAPGTPRQINISIDRKDAVIRTKKIIRLNISN